MKIYLTAPLNGGKTFEKRYLLIEKALQSLDNKVLTGLTIKRSLQKKHKNRKEPVKVYRQLYKSLKSAEIAVVETTYPSLSVGHEISLALELNKPVIALHFKNKRYNLLNAIPNEKLQIVRYDNTNLKKQLEKAIKIALETVDVRFNFFITPQLLSYLDWISGKKRVPRSVFVRGLIENDMRKNREYLED
ncbi:hypothetical protein ACFL1Q_02015 [Patescibacteria group bacterium]